MDPMDQIITMSEQNTNVLKALVEAQGSVPHLPKTGVNPHFNSRYIPLDEIIKATGPILVKHGLGVVKSGGWNGDVFRVVTRLVHVTGEWIQTQIELSAPQQKKGEKELLGPNKGAFVTGALMTYGSRFCEGSLLRISSDEDSETHVDNSTKKENGGKDRTDQRPTPPESKGRDSDMKKKEWKEVRGTITKVDTKEGERDDGTPWVKYGLKVGESWFSTFDKKIGVRGKDLCETGEEATIFYSEKGKYKTVEQLFPMVTQEDDQPPQDLPF